MKFAIFSHGTDLGTEGLRRHEIEGDERQARQAIRFLEVLGYAVDDCLEETVDGGGQRRYCQLHSGQRCMKEQIAYHGDC